eukprot:scaffold17568_cov33-Tisochrysis_lutea.AAC.3
MGWKAGPEYRRTASTSSRSFASCEQGAERGSGGKVHGRTWRCRSPPRESARRPRTPEHQKEVSGSTTQSFPGAIWRACGDRAGLTS